MISHETLLKIHKCELFTVGRQETRKMEECKDLGEKKWKKIHILFPSRSFNADVWPCQRLHQVLLYRAFQRGGPSAAESISP